MNVLKTPHLRKADLVIGRTLVFRNATVTDATFILSLRTDAEKSRHLSAVSSYIADQIGWLENYSRIDDQAYFIVLYQDEPIGTVRLYDPQGGSFCWGSWILKDGAPGHAAIESALMVYAYAIDHLGFEAAHFEVRKENERVWRFHERFGAYRVGETALDYLYSLDENAIVESRRRYRRFLDTGVKVEFI